MLARLPVGMLFGAAAIVAAAALALNWLVPSGWYLFEPNGAKPLAAKVTVEGEKADDDGGGIYYIDVTVRQASWLERLHSVFRPEGSTMIPERDLIPEGTSFEDRRASSRREMERSEQVAAAVALEEAGLGVAATPDGALIVTVARDAPAWDVLQDGDVVVEAGGRRVRTPADLREATGRIDPGDRLELRIRRDGKTQAVIVKTVPSPDDSERAIIGVRVTQDADIKLPTDVDIDLGGVGGPSAGLAFALDILEELGEDVDRGRKVVATGEIELDGAVSPVGGIRQKTVGARRSGADIFLVPGENAAEARQYAGDMRVVPVDSFQQALRELRTNA